MLKLHKLYIKSVIESLSVQDQRNMLPFGTIIRLKWKAALSLDSLPCLHLLHPFVVYTLPASRLASILRDHGMCTHAMIS